MLLFNFHRVDPGAACDRIQRSITISPQGLRHFIAVLREAGYSLVSLGDVLARGGPSAGKAEVVLTFDDGYENNFRYGLPVLEEMQAPATIFVLPGRFGGTNEWDAAHLPEERRDRLMSLEQIRAISRSPWVTIGSHGLYHRRFPTLPAEALRTEIQASFDILASELAERFLPVLAYPWGDYDGRVLEAMALSPYRYAFTTEKGLWEPGCNPHAIPRYTALHRDGNPWLLRASLIRNGLYAPLSGLMKALA